MVRYKKDLAGQLGNLLARSTAPALIPSGTVPVYNKDAVTKDDRVLQDQLQALPGTGTASMSSLCIFQYLIITLCRSFL
jgi:hypothetical protein